MGSASRPTPGVARRPSWLWAALGTTLFQAAGLAAQAGDLATPATPMREETPRLASRADSSITAGTVEAPVSKARRMIADCQAKYAGIRDYTCTFVKRERVEGRLAAPHVMHMKARSRPNSIYFRFHKPNKGREAIYVAGRHGGKVLAHDVGLGRLLAGTMNLDPNGSMAMEDCRHPITEAGIGALIETIAKRWAIELSPDESEVRFDPHMTIGPRRVTMIESAHPIRQPSFLFHKVRLYIDHEHGLPVRFEAYDWPKHPGATPELVEEYSYNDLKLNVGLTDHDFDTANKAYSFGRF